MLNRNVYWDEDGSIDFAGKSFDEWKQKGIDAESVVADPQFTDPAKRDFSLKPNSPALQKPRSLKPAAKLQRWSTT